MIPDRHVSLVQSFFHRIQHFSNNLVINEAMFEALVES